MTRVLTVTAEEVPSVEEAVSQLIGTESTVDSFFDFLQVPLVRGLITLFLCLLLAKVLLTVLRRMLARTHMEETMRKFVRSIMTVLVYAVALLIAADSFGINVSSLVAVLSIFGAAMALAAYGGGRQGLRLLLLFLALSCALAGILVMISLLWDGHLSYPRGIPVTPPDWKALLLAAAGCYWLSATVLRRLVPSHGRELIPVKLRWDCRQVSMTALYDTGNLLSGPDGSPVLVAHWQSVAPLLPDIPRIRREDVCDPVGGLSRIGAGWGAGRLHLLPYQGVSAGRGLLLAVRVDSAVLDSRVIHRQLVALSPEPLSDGRYQAVIGR